MISQEMERIARENAIKELKEFQIDIGSCQDDLDNSPLYYALGMAIKALEQTELNPSYNGVKTELKSCEDCISREAAIGIIAHIKEMHINDREQYHINYGTICDIDSALQQLPSITPRPKGKWKPLNYKDEMWGYVYKCSNCGVTEYGYNYCPNCGADMRGDNE